ncbi:murein DD-endopeptidase MepM/ murein hydrolase activator NlpD [Crossiella equi]|uniref:Murein DD-endopeptidase MepM/ murein hydrolase activator NlpD n=1 Tax=Crossiella equi TaxID=130796 RepID=A0ABS5ACI4_9PSEU|nr:M23 family metallopeptidase [Crossiella equi]MBP2474290.1 murein DD-endopeptidase MepM/ murein hydrolase activator NlpD [Crossiella equi]
MTAAAALTTTVLVGTPGYMLSTQAASASPEPVDLQANLAAVARQAPTVLPKADTADPGVELAKLDKAIRIADEEKARTAEAEKAAADKAEAEKAAAEAAKRAATAVEKSKATGAFVRPAQGRFTSNYGMRGGVMHYGVDIANSIGTPILSAAAGTVVESGPASGFGLWVRVQHNDGTITVYGHINTSLVRAGQKVQAGEQIATMGNRGQSTGPHLHFEVWAAGGKKVNPGAWLAERGIKL